MSFIGAGTSICGNSRAVCRSDSCLRAQSVEIAVDCPGNSIEKNSRKGAEIQGLSLFFFVKIVISPLFIIKYMKKILETSDIDREDGHESGRPTPPATVKLRDRVPEDVNLFACRSCGTCSSGCPAAGLAGMDPRRFVHMIALGMDQAVLESEWIWMCTMCRRCQYACPMDVDIPALILQARSLIPRESRPEGIRESCDLALETPGCSAMAVSDDDWHFVVEDVLEEVRITQAGCDALTAPIDRKGACFFLNQNSKEPMLEPDEMVPLWKILHRVGASWTYGSQGWAAENYCMFLADKRSWERIVRTKARAVDELGCRIWLNTE